MNSPAAWSPPVASNTVCAARSRSGSDATTDFPTDRPVGHRLAVLLDLVEGRLAAQAATRVGDEAALGRVEHDPVAAA